MFDDFDCLFCFKFPSLSVCVRPHLFSSVMLLISYFFCTWSPANAGLSLPFPYATLIHEVWTKKIISWQCLIGLDTHTSVTLFVVVVFCLGHIMTSWWITFKCLILRLLYRVWTHHPDIQTCATVMSKSPLLSLEWAPKPDRLVRQQLLKVGIVWPTAS